ncbi:hypothetical protein [Psychrosphaera algicola]|uniref:hypothetical protein n=1 Tax=Psychrosphaera algicola TaxID=3023714 RepID=UPI002FEE3A31
MNVPRSAGYAPFRESRCVIVAKGFGETEFVQHGKQKVPKHYYDLTAKDGAIAFGGCIEIIIINRLEKSSPVAV